MNEVVIYPSSWYYNACVQGFLEVLAYGLGESTIEEHLLQDDGSIKIPGNLMEAVFSDRSVAIPEPYRENVTVPDEVADLKRIAWWWVEKSYKLGIIRSADKEKTLTDEEKLYSVIGRVCHFQMGEYPNMINPGLKPTERKKEQTRSIAIYGYYTRFRYTLPILWGLDIFRRS